MVSVFFSGPQVLSLILEAGIANALVHPQLRCIALRAIIILISIYKSCSGSNVIEFMCCFVFGCARLCRGLL